MKNKNNIRLGIMFRREYPPETLPEFACQAEALGFDELWVVEDCFYGSGVATAATALAFTKSISVGLGIMPAVVRNPVCSAMEIATLDRLFPGRFLPGFGHGVAEWMRQIGAFPRSQLKALEEVTLVVKKLLSGEQIDFRGLHVHVEQAKLVHPPAEIPPISLGVIGPKSLALSGKVADGTILSEYSNPAYITWAKQQIARGLPDFAHSQDRPLTVFSFAHAGKSKTESCRKLRPMISEAILSGGLDVKLSPMGILPQVKALVEQNGREKFKDRFPDSWISELTIAGTTGDWEKSISKLAELGVQSVVLVPLPDSNPEEIKILAKHIF